MVAKTTTEKKQKKCLKMCVDAMLEEQSVKISDFYLWKVAQRIGKLS